MLGMSYQIIDDILDFTGTEEELGKPSGDDLLQGNITLPVLFAMKDQTIYSEIIKVHENMPRNEIDRIIHLIKQSDAIERSREMSNRYLDKGIAHIRNTSGKSIEEDFEKYSQVYWKTKILNVAIIS